MLEVTFMYRCQVPYRFVFTKTDLVFIEDLARTVYKTKQDIADHPDKYAYLVRDEPNAQQMVRDTFAIFASSRQKSGIHYLRNEIASFSTLTEQEYANKQRTRSFL